MSKLLLLLVLLRINQYPEKATLRVPNVWRKNGIADPGSCAKVAKLKMHVGINLIKLNALNAASQRYALLEDPPLPLS